MIDIEIIDMISWYPHNYVRKRMPISRGRIGSGDDRKEDKGPFLSRGADRARQRRHPEDGDNRVFMITN